MNVQLDHHSHNGEKTVRLVANDLARTPTTIRAWIKMLRIAELWMLRGDNPNADGEEPGETQK